MSRKILKNWWLPGDDAGTYREREERTRRAEVEREAHDDQVWAAKFGAKLAKTGPDPRNKGLHVDTSVLTDPEIDALIRGYAVAKALEKKAERAREREANKATRRALVRKGAD